MTTMARRWPLGSSGLKPSYRLVCCNLAGTNAFFVREDSAGRFANYAPSNSISRPGST